MKYYTTTLKKICCFFGITPSCMNLNVKFIALKEEVCLLILFYIRIKNFVSKFVGSIRNV